MGAPAMQIARQPSQAEACSGFRSTVALVVGDDSFKASFRILPFPWSQLRKDMKDIDHQAIRITSAFLVVAGAEIYDLNKSDSLSRLAAAVGSTGGTHAKA